MTRALVFILWASACILTSSPGADWPQWRGPERNGISSEKIFTAWPSEGPRVLWRAAIGTGFSSFSVSQGRLFTMGNANDRDSIWCLDAVTGKNLWRHTYDSKL